MSNDRYPDNKHYRTDLRAYNRLTRALAATLDENYGTYTFARAYVPGYRYLSVLAGTVRRATSGGQSMEDSLTIVDYHDTEYNRLARVILGGVRQSIHDYLLEPADHRVSRLHQPDDLDHAEDTDRLRQLLATASFTYEQSK